MKRVLLRLAYCLSFFILFVASPAYATDEMSGIHEKVGSTQSELNELAAVDAARERGLGKVDQRFTLYDHSGVARFVLCVTDRGYVVFDSVSNLVVEWGEGANPYSGYEGDKKYYGGFGCAQVAVNGSFLNVQTGEESSEPAYLQGIDLLENGNKSIEGFLASKTLLTASAKAVSSSYEMRVPYDKQYLRGLAFANNTKGTCYTVAIGILLNYFDRTITDGFVDKSMEHEQLTSVAVKDGIFSNAPKARLLHNTLYKCGVQDRATWWDAVNAIEKYR